MVIVRDVARIIGPVGVRCALCKLYIDEAATARSERPGAPGALNIEIRYNGDEVCPENPLCALTRRKFICDECAIAIKEAL